MPACFRCAELEEDISSLSYPFPSIGEDVRKLEKLIEDNGALRRRCYGFSQSDRVYCSPVSVDSPESGLQQNRCTLVYERIDRMSYQMWYLFDNDLRLSDEDIVQKLQTRRVDPE